MKKNVYCLLCLLIHAYFLSVSNAKAENVSYVGYSTCRLNPSFNPGMFRLPIENIKPGYAIEYRRINKQKCLLIIDGVKVIGGCGRIIKQFRLPKIRSGESVQFNCITKEHHQDNNIIIGIALNKNGRVRFVKPRLAWSLNIDKIDFDKISSTNVICDTIGYEE